MIGKRRRVFGAWAVTLAVTLVLAGCARGGTPASDGGEESSPGITDSEVIIGTSNPLSGPVAGPGRCLVDGASAYFAARNDAGGVEFGDGKTRTVEVESLDDEYDPQKAKSNYDQLHNDVFLMGLGLGTPTNRAWREAAIADEVPQVLTETGDPLFSNTAESPWQLDAFPTYVSEGKAFGDLLVESTEEHEVAILSQNDNYGEDYVEGLKYAIDGEDTVTIVEELTYEATDDSIDSQIAELSESGADIFFNIVSQPPLTISGLEKAQELGWTPSWFLPSNTSSTTAILEPGNAAIFPAVYTASYQKDPDDPDYLHDEDMQQFLDALSEYSGRSETPDFPHCMWGYMSAAILERVFEEMTEPTREEFMTQLRSIAEYEPPLALPGAVVDTTAENEPAISEVMIEKYEEEGYVRVDRID